MQNNLLPYSILVIEDEINLRKQLVEILKFDYENVYKASNAETALDIYKDKKPDIMIVDINLPNMSGLDLIKIIRENDHSTKTIVLTAHSEVEYLKKATSLKLVDYIVKPLSRKVLNNTLNKAILEIQKFTISTKKCLALKDQFIWNIEEKRLMRGSTEIHLSVLETKLLDLLIQNRNIVLDFDTIIINLWDDYENDKMNSLKTLIRKLRTKLPADSIKNIYNGGYTFIY